MVDKHKVIHDFQFTTQDKKIVILRSGTILENYVFISKDGDVLIDKDIVNNNPDFFQSIDWKMDLVRYLKTNKVPQPAIIGKKLIPFVEELISSSHRNQEPDFDVDGKLLEIEMKEKRISIREDDLSSRQRRIESRESLHKEDIFILDKKEKELHQKVVELKSLQNEIDRRLSEVNERERNFDRNALSSSQEIDTKYREMQSKIEEDLKSLSQKENLVESKLSDLSSKEIDLMQREENLLSRIRSFEIEVSDFKIWAEEVINLDSEIKSWEALNWKMKRLRKRPPSSIID